MLCGEIPNPHMVEKEALLRIPPILPYIKSVQASGISSSGILHRILAHTAAVNFMQMTVSYFGFICQSYSLSLPKDGG